MPCGDLNREQERVSQNYNLDSQPANNRRLAEGCAAVPAVASRETVPISFTSTRLAHARRVDRHTL